MRAKFLLAIIITSLLLGFTTRVNADELNISRMEIDIWPEYDQSSVLVIFRVSFSSLASFPNRVSLRIPASAGNPYSVAMKDLDGLLYDLEYTIIPDGDWNKLEFVTSSPDLQIEFYEPYIQHADSSRSYDFRWISNYFIDNLSISIQKPRYSSNMTVLPDAGEGVVNPDDGLTYYLIDITGIGPGSIVYARLSYIKTNAGLSASIVPVKPISPLPEESSFWQTIVSSFPLIWNNKSLLSAGGLLLGGLIFFNVLIVFVGGSKPKSRNKTPVSPTGSQKTQRASDEENEIYCYQCGKRARPGDAFCRTCGSKIIE